MSDSDALDESVSYEASLSQFYKFLLDRCSWFLELFSSRVLTHLLPKSYIELWQS